MPNRPACRLLFTPSQAPGIPRQQERGDQTPRFMKSRSWGVSPSGDSQWVLPRETPKEPTFPPTSLCTENLAATRHENDRFKSKYVHSSINSFFFV